MKRNRRGTEDRGEDAGGQRRNARELLGHVADELRSRLPPATVDVHSKPSAGKPIDADVADMLAARSHLVISGVGD